MGCIGLCILPPLDIRHGQLFLMFSLGSLHPTLTRAQSIFGMTNIPDTLGFNKLAVTMLAICMPTYFVIIYLDPRGSLILKGLWGRLAASLFLCLSGFWGIVRGFRGIARGHRY